MLLSPIFLALGAVATSVLNAGGRFAAAAVAPIVYNLAIIGAALILGRSMGVTGLAVGVVAGALGHLLVQVRPLPRLGFRYTPADRPRRPPGAQGAGADGAAGRRPRREPDHVRRRHLARVDPRHRRGHQLQRRVHAAPDPDRGHRRAARGRRLPVAVARGRRRARAELRRPADPRAAAARLRDGPDRGARGDPAPRRASTCSSTTAATTRPP